MRSNTNREEFEETCATFINTVNNYFTKLTDNPSETGVPYLKEQYSTVLKDYTGMIGVSGNKRGFFYITSDKGLYEELIQEFVGLDDPTNEDILDMSGELSNVVAGNLRETYGSEFMISIPIVFEGKPDNFKFPGDLPVYVIPINWKNHQADVVVGLS